MSALVVIQATGFLCRKLYDWIEYFAYLGVISTPLWRSWGLDDWNYTAILGPRKKGMHFFLGPRIENVFFLGAGVE